jgi:hypothetical protein
LPMILGDPRPAHQGVTPVHRLRPCPRVFRRTEQQAISARNVLPFRPTSNYLAIRSGAAFPPSGGGPASPFRDAARPCGGPLRRFRLALSSLAFRLPEP